MLEAESRAQLDALRTQLEQLNHELARAEGTAAAWRERVATQLSLVTERKVRLAQVKEQVEAARAALERVDDARCVELRGARQQARRRAERGLGRVRRDRGAHHGRARAAHRGRRRPPSWRTPSSTKRARLLEQVRQSLAGQEVGAEDAARRARGAGRSRAAHEMAAQRIGLEREHLLTKVRERFRGLELRRVVGDYHMRMPPDAEQRRRIDELDAAHRSHGPGEPRRQGASTTRPSAASRSSTTRRSTSRRRLIELEHAIKHMNKESRRRFKETFDAVNDLFKKTFHKMFRGGKAELSLTDPDDMLGSGVDILAQPPGKKLGNIELMSGGEKALTAVSLIFAIFQHRPSPFCILDEVDAPLDEANVARYNEAIRSMTHSSQFILITHIKKTMQSVDVLYGVTMGEPGVSRVVSVKVNENASSRSDALAAHGGARPRSRRRRRAAERRVVDRAYDLTAACTAGQWRTPRSETYRRRG